VCAAGTVSSNDFKNGMTLEIDGAPWRVQGEHPRGVPTTAACQTSAVKQMLLSVCPLTGRLATGRGHSLHVRRLALQAVFQHGAYTKWCLVSGFIVHESPACTCTQSSCT